MSQNTIVEFAGVTKRYRDMCALSDVSFELREGEVLGYLGPNGAGKTTTLKILAGLLRKFEGEARILGHSLPDQNQAVHEWIGFLPQSVGFQEWRTPQNALRSFGILSGVPSGEIEGRIGKWLERFELSKSRNKKIKNLSGGMIQKLGLIQALLHEPKLLILDEPLAGLDPASRRLVKDVVRESRDAGITVMFSSHILSDVEDVADRIGIVESGRLLTSSSIEDLRAESPTRVEVEFSVEPSDTDFMHRLRSVEEVNPPAGPAEERSKSNHRSNPWHLRVRDGTDPDELIHAVIESTLSREGRIRRIGTVPPDLDLLYSQYVDSAKEES